jgi:hypothetical protein
MVDIAQVHATLVAGKTWLVLASSACVLRYATSAGAAFPAPSGRQFNPSACSPRRKDAKIPVTLCDNAYANGCSLLIIKSDHPYLARSSVASSLGFSISIRLGGAVVDS